MDTSTGPPLPTDDQIQEEYYDPVNEEIMTWEKKYKDEVSEVGEVLEEAQTQKRNMSEECRQIERERCDLMRELRRITTEYEAQVVRGARLAGAVGENAREARELQAELLRAQSDELGEMAAAATARFQSQRLDEIVRRNNADAAATVGHEEEVARELQEELVT